MGITTIAILTDVAFGHIQRLSRTTYASNDFAVGAHGLFVAAHLLSVTAIKKKQLKIRQSVYQYTKISEGILEDILKSSFIQYLEQRNKTVSYKLVNMKSDRFRKC